MHRTTATQDVGGVPREPSVRGGASLVRNAFPMGLISRIKGVTNRRFAPSDSAKRRSFTQRSAREETLAPRTSAPCSAGMEACMGCGMGGQRLVSRLGARCGCMVWILMGASVLSWLDCRRIGLDRPIILAQRGMQRGMSLNEVWVPAGSEPGRLLLKSLEGDVDLVGQCANALTFLRYNGFVEGKGGTRASALHR